MKTVCPYKHPYCQKCYKEVLARHGTFNIKCKGILEPDEIIPQKYLVQFSVEERQMAYGIYDPVAWAAQNLNWVPRSSGSVPITLRDGHVIEPHTSYQSLMLKCTAQRKVFRLGRRTGKCLDSSAQVITAAGPMDAKSLNNTIVKPSIITFDQHTQKLTTTTNYTIWSNGIRQVFDLETANGRRTRVTANHPFLVMGEDGIPVWLEVQDLKPGMRLAVPSSYRGLVTGGSMDLDEARLLGYLCGDGGCSSNYIGFTNHDQAIVDDVANIVQSYNCVLTPNGAPGNYRISKKPRTDARNHVKKLCQENKIDCLAIHKQVPLSIMSGDEAAVISFLGSYWDCDGWLSVSKAAKGRKSKRVEIGACSASEKLARDVKHLLLRLGINSNIAEKKVKYNGSHRLAWQITILDQENQQRFMNLIPLRCKADKILSIRLILEEKAKPNRNQDTIPIEIWKYIKATQQQLGFSDRDVCGSPTPYNNNRLRTQYAPSRDKVRTYAANLQDEYLESVANSDIIWDTVVSVSFAGNSETYDLSVPETQTLIADDIVSHNTASLSVRSVHFMATNAYVKVLVVAPFKSQIDLVFKMIQEHIGKSDVLKASIKRSVTTPYHEIEFWNGSYIRGFTSGTKSGAEAGAVRGQAADIIILDEMDYLAAGDINSIIAILNDHPDTQLWASSTPTGRRDKFFEWCNNPRYKEFHYPSHVLPHWNDEMEAEARENHTESAYRHEILAEFGEEEEGVFQKIYIDAAKENYSYATVSIDSKWIYGLGIDWNSEIFGTEIVCCGFNGHEVRVVDRRNIARLHWNQTAAIQAVIEMNRKWNPYFIYADEGYGITAIEILRQFGWENVGKNLIDAKLKDIIHAVNFSSKIEVPDPITKEKIKKPMKPFMVENAVRFFEQGNIKISEHDKELTNQLENYIVKRRTDLGMPVYCIRQDHIGDHALDGLMLCLLGFTDKFSSLMRVDYTTIIRFAGRIGAGYSKQQQLEELNPAVIVVDARDKENTINTKMPVEKRPNDRMRLNPQVVSDKVTSSGLYGSSPRPWKWPGFMKDQPAPARKMKAYGRPSRKNI